MTTNQEAMEQRAREVLAAEFDKGGYRSQADTLRSGADVSDSMYLTRWTTAIRAIAAALTDTIAAQGGVAVQEWERKSMASLAASLRGMSRVDEGSLSDAASWLEKFAAAPAQPVEQTEGEVVRAMRFALEQLQRHVEVLVPECECESCPECGNAPIQCSDTPCAETRQCSLCEHCCAKDAIDGLESALVLQPSQSSGYRDAYEGAREDLLDWRRRAQRAEAELRRLGYRGVIADESPAAMGELTEDAADIARELLASVDVLVEDGMDTRDVVDLFRRAAGIISALSARTAPTDSAMVLAVDWLRSLPRNEHIDALEEAACAYDPSQVGARTAPVEGDCLHPATADLVDRFGAALRAKLAAAERKYGYSDGWLQPDWMDECRQKLAEHVAKGDPRDVAAYCAFLWHHGESTAATALVVWEGRRYPNGLKRYLTQKQYDAQTTATKAHYKPVCETCASTTAPVVGDADTRRLNWLATNPRGAEIVVNGKSEPCVFWGVSSAPDHTLREAIDAAMQADTASTVSRGDSHG